MSKEGRFVFIDVLNTVIRSIQSTINKIKPLFC